MKNSLVQVHPNAKIGENVTIESFSTVYEDVEIGDGTWIGPNVTIMNGARIGKNCKIFPGAVISGPPQDLKYAGEETHTYIGDNTTVRECVTVHKGTTESLKTEVGSNVLLMAYVHVAHDCKIGDNCILANSVQVAGHVEVDDYAIIGGTSAIHQFVKVGAHVMIAGGSLVRKDVPPYVKAVREPLTYGGVNIIGLRRRGFSAEQVAEIQEAYRHIFLSGLNNRDAQKAVEEDMRQTEERDIILEFLRRADRGIIRGSTGNKKD